MALGTPTVLELSAGDGPLRTDLISFAGDGAYVAGGTAAFQLYVRNALKALTKANVEVLAVIPQDCGGKTPCYDKAADKLKVYDGTTEQANGSLSATTFHVLVLSK